MLFVNNCTFILFNKNEIIYHQETSMLRSLSTDTITHTTNQPDKETTSKPTLLYILVLCVILWVFLPTAFICICFNYVVLLERTNKDIIYIYSVHDQKICWHLVNNYIHCYGYTHNGYSLHNMLTCI